MRLLIASITNAPPDVLTAHLETVLWQELPEGWSADYLYLVDNTDSTPLDAAGIPWEAAAPKPEGARHAVTEATHDWSIPTFHWLAEQKQVLLDTARENHYDALLLVDSDLLLSPRTIASLISTEKTVVSGVFWTRWNQNDPPLPQVWLQQPYGFTGMGLSEQEFFSKLAARELIRVAGLGACTLIRADAFPRLAFWPLVPGLPTHGMWQGEDRHFCVTATRNRVELWADPWPEIFHIYRPSQVAQIPEALAALGSMGRDMVSCIIEPLEEPQLAGYRRLLRCDLRNARLTPDLHQHLSEMLVGEERIVRLRFPSHWPAYPGQQRVFRIRLLDAQAATPAEILQGMR